MPSAPSASKNASCGLTATAYGATASTMPRQKRAAGLGRRSPRSSTGKQVDAGIEADAELASLALDCGGETVGERRCGELGLYAELLRHRLDQAYAPRPTATTPSKPQVVFPAQWGAAPTRLPLPARGPLDHLVLHHTAFPMSRIGGTSFEAEAAHMREIQRWHLERGWATVGYHFVVSPSGRIFRGRPGRPARSARARPQRGHGRDLPDGQLRARAPTPAALESLTYVRSRLVPGGAKARLLGHRDHRGHETSACPGRNLEPYADKRGGPPPGGPPSKRRSDP